MAEFHEKAAPLLAQRRVEDLELPPMIAAPDGIRYYKRKEDVRKYLSELLGRFFVVAEDGWARQMAHPSNNQFTLLSPFSCFNINPF